MGGGDRSAFELLGLEPGAGREAIEQAYRQLIKLYHPDREGGDPLRAAEITGAYRELRGHRSRGEEVEFHQQPAAGPTSAGWQIIALSVAIVLLSLAILAGGPFDNALGPRSPGVPVKSSERVPAPDSPIEQPIDLGRSRPPSRRSAGCFGPRTRSSSPSLAVTAIRSFGSPPISTASTAASPSTMR